MADLGIYFISYYDKPPPPKKKTKKKNGSKNCIILGINKNAKWWDYM